MSDERGIALVVTLLVITLLSIYVVEFTYSTQIDDHLARNHRNAVQAEALARSGLAFGEMALILDAVQKAADKSLPNVETLNDLWAKPFGPLPIAEGFGEIGYVIVDEAARFNVNALALAQNPLTLEMRKQLFQGILESVGLETNLLFPLLDWLDEDDETDRKAGAESEYYAGLSPPYAPRNGKVLSIDELALVKGFDGISVPQWRQLREMLTALPDDSLDLNVNTAPEALLVAVAGAAGDATIAGAMVAQRESAPFSNLRELNDLPGMKQIPPLMRSVFKVRSQRFTIYGVGETSGVRRGVAALVNRSGQKLSTLRWTLVAAPPSLTTPGASDGIDASLP